MALDTFVNPEDEAIRDNSEELLDQIAMEFALPEAEDEDEIIEY